MCPPEEEADETLERLLEEHGPAIDRMVRRMCPPSRAIDPDEVCQEVRLRLWRALRSERNIERPASYLYRAAVSAAIDAVRRARARREVQMDPASGHGGPTPMPGVEDARPGPERLARSAELGASLAAAIDSLAENRRRAVKLHLQGFNSTEIAELLGWTEAKARNLASRGMADLRQRLLKEGFASDLD